MQLICYSKRQVFADFICVGFSGILIKRRYQQNLIDPQVQAQLLLKSFSVYIHGEIKCIAHQILIQCPL